jgi:hypothetical protein
MINTIRITAEFVASLAAYAAMLDVSYKTFAPNCAK